MSRGGAMAGYKHRARLKKQARDAARLYLSARYEWASPSAIELIVNHGRYRDAAGMIRLLRSQCGVEVSSEQVRDAAHALLVPLRNSALARKEQEKLKNRMIDAIKRRTKAKEEVYI